MQRLQGDGLAFVHAGVMLRERTLGPGELIRVARASRIDAASVRYTRCDASADQSTGGK